MFTHVMRVHYTIVGQPSFLGPGPFYNIFVASFRIIIVDLHTFFYRWLLMPLVSCAMICYDMLLGPVPFYRIFVASCRIVIIDLRTFFCGGLLMPLVPCAMICYDMLYF